MKTNIYNFRYHIVLGTVVGFVIFVFMVFTLVPNSTTSNIKTYIRAKQTSANPDTKDQGNPQALKDCIDAAKAKQRSSYIELNSTFEPQDGFPNARRWNRTIIDDKEGQNTVLEAIAGCENFYAIKL